MTHAQSAELTGSALTTPGNLRRLVTATVFFLSVSAFARATPIYDFLGGILVSANPAYHELVQGSDGTVTFTVTAPVDMTVVLDKLDPGFVYMDTIDPQDEITKIARTGGNCGVGSIITDAAGCTFTVGYVTDDPRRPLDPDKDYGVWHVFLDVHGHQLTDANNLGTGEGSTTVVVLDPGAVTPEPGTFGLGALAAVGLIAVRIRKWSILNVNARGTSLPTRPVSPRPE
jgi:hypothetical protein